MVSLSHVFSLASTGLTSYYNDLSFHIDHATLLESRAMKCITWVNGKQVLNLLPLSPYSLEAGTLFLREAV